MSVHASSILAEDVLREPDLQVGPFCVIGVDGAGGPTQIGEGAVLRSHVVLYRGTRVGAGFHAGHHALLREESVLGDSVSVGSGSIIEHHVTIGDRVRIHSGCFVPEHSVLEADAWLGPGVVVTNARYPNQPDTKDRLEGVTVCEGAVVGAGVVLLPGVIVGARALIGAGAVIVRDVEPNATVVGNPGRALR